MQMEIIGRKSFDMNKSKISFAPYQMISHLEHRLCMIFAAFICFRVATVRGKISGNEFFQVREKSGNFVDGQGNLERLWKVREKSGN